MLQNSAISEIGGHGHLPLALRKDICCGAPAGEVEVQNGTAGEAVMLKMRRSRRSCKLCMSRGKASLTCSKDLRRSDIFQYCQDPQSSLMLVRPGGESCP